VIIFSIVESAVVFTCFHTWNDFKLYARLHPRLSTNVRLGEDTNENARWRIHSVGSAFVTVRRYQYHYTPSRFQPECWAPTIPSLSYDGGNVTLHSTAS
jgi:hypothetical protein